MQLEVIFLPPIATDLPGKVCVVIDVLRATSTAVTMFEAGAKRVTLAESVPAALTYASSLAKRPLVCGEVGGVAPVGFDRGNSPREFPPGSLEGREVVFYTSNGTRAMRLVSNAPVVLAGSLFNASAVAAAAVREARERGLGIALVCSGDALGTKFAIDDAFCAGYLATGIQREAGQSSGPGAGDGRAAIDLEESATAAVRLYRSYLRAGDGGPARESILEAFWESHNAQVLKRVGLAEDVEYCARPDVSDIVPALRVDDGKLVLHAGREGPRQGER
jgi:2-phosphosulfolactate phosphatase